MRKYIDLVVFKYIELKLWLHAKKKMVLLGTSFSLVYFGCL